jgi:hypothetical protein
VRSAASDFQVEPSVTVSEESDDNVYLHPVDTTSDFITRIIPSIHVRYNTPLWDWDATYAYEFRYYYLQRYREDASQRLNLLSTTRLVKDFFLVDIKDEYSSVSLSPTQDFVQLSLTANQTKQNIFTLNPYLIFRPTSRTKLITGYEYRNVWYQDPVAIDKNVYAVYADLTQDMTDRLSMTASGRYESTDSTLRDFRHITYLVGPKYEYRDQSVAWLRAGQSTFRGNAPDLVTRPIWDAGVKHKLSTITLTYETGRTWIDDPINILKREDRYIFGLSREVERTTFGVTAGYRDYGTGKYTDEARYSSTVSFGHFLTEKLQGQYQLSVDRYERYPVASANTFTTVWLTDVRFTYHVNATLTYALEFRHADSYSGEVYLDNYESNRIIAEIAKRF